MTRSVSFDQAADIYNATRGFPPGVGDQVAGSVVTLVGPSARVLEMGIGTGRIAIPLLTHGLRVAGIDLSRRMMGRLREGLPPAVPAPILAEADAARLPFASACFDAVIGVHVFHLIAGWREALGEARRCLKPSGQLLLGYDWHPSEGPPYRLRTRWGDILRRLGVHNQPGAPSFDAVRAALLASGATKDDAPVAHWMRTHTLGEQLDSIIQRVSSSTWNMPDEVFGRAYAELEAWALAELGARDQTFTTEFKFVWERYWWPSPRPGLRPS
jgi:SAM-dependent methyltransferase